MSTEFDVMKKVITQFERLPNKAARDRVLNYINDVCASEETPVQAAATLDSACREAAAEVAEAL